jgi:uncharacterized protein
LIRQTPVGIELDVRVIPRARKDEIAGTRGGALLVRLAAPPVEGAANAALIELIAHQLDVPRKAVRIVGGERARDKRVEVAGIAAGDAARRLGVWSPP